MIDRHQVHTVTSHCNSAYTSTSPLHTVNQQHITTQSQHTKNTFTTLPSEHQNQPLHHCCSQQSALATGNIVITWCCISSTHSHKAAHCTSALEEGGGKLFRVHLNFHLLTGRQRSSPSSWCLGLLEGREWPQWWRRRLWFSGTAARVESCCLARSLQAASLWHLCYTNVIRYANTMHLYHSAHCHYWVIAIILLHEANQCTYS